MTYAHAVDDGDHDHVKSHVQVLIDPRCSAHLLLPAKYRPKSTHVSRSLVGSVPQEELKAWMAEARVDLSSDESQT